MSSHQDQLWDNDDRSGKTSLNQLPTETIYNVVMKRCVERLSSFPERLWAELSDDSKKHEDMCLRWSNSGEHVIVCKDKETNEIPLTLVGSGRQTTFIRKLYQYSFKRVTTTDESDGHEWMFQHPYFQRSKPELLKYVVRKRPRTTKQLVKFV